MRRRCGAPLRCYAAALERLVTCCIGCESCFDKTVKTAGPGYVLMAWVLILGVIWVFFSILMPLSYDTSTPGGKAHLALGVCFSFNILFNYAMCVRTDPGAPPDVFDSAEGGDAPASAGRVSAPEPPLSLPPRARWCRKCHNVKPALAHHCSVCGRCVLKMDHHCPWMNNCVGLCNYRYFFLFLFYLWAGCAYACAMCYAPVSDEPDLAPLRAALAWRFGVTQPQLRMPPAPRPGGRELTLGERSAVLFSFILAAAVFVALSILLGWHVYLVFSAQTTIDYYSNREAARAAKRAGRAWSNDCDLGPRRNWQETFDERGPLWWLMWAAPRLRRRGGRLAPPSVAEEAAKRGRDDGGAAGAPR